MKWFASALILSLLSSQVDALTFAHIEAPAPLHEEEFLPPQARSPQERHLARHERRRGVLPIKACIVSIFREPPAEPIVAPPLPPSPLYHFMSLQL
ncbi:MAG: hypothetical protein U0793_31990 [Gemmataceae bacterium]